MKYETAATTFRAAGRAPQRFFLAIAVMLGTAFAGQVLADDGPAIDTSGGALQRAPAPTDAPAVGTTPPAGRSDGTNVIGEQESPIGLFIIPWRSSSPSPQMDRPARFIDETEEPVDRTQFTRFVEYYGALTRHREAQQAAGTRSE